MYKFPGEQLITVTITPDIVKEKLLKLPGMDILHPFFLIKNANAMCPLCIIYNNSLYTGICPYQWLEALIAAIHKNGLREGREL